MSQLPHDPLGEDVSADYPASKTEATSDYYDRIEVVLTHYRKQYEDCAAEAADRNLTQEYRTFHHIRARCLREILNDLDRIQQDA